MATCPNKNLESWKNLVAARGEDVAYYLWDKYDGNVPESESKSSIVKAGLKSINALQSSKAIQLFSTLEKNKIIGEAFWNKVQSDLQIPKDQIELLKQYNTIDREKLITNMLADYSYTIEINTSLEEDSNQNYGENITSGFRRGPFKYWINYKSEYIKKVVGEDNPQIKISKEEYEEAFAKKEYKPTSHYSYLTVPGGTNYTENEIATSAITPSIKGHAQFSTDQGIGWFRSDEQISKAEDKFALVIEQETGEKPGSKTRRILEVQSDLFQKGRDKERLASEMSKGKLDYDTGHISFEHEGYIYVRNDDGMFKGTKKKPYEYQLKQKEFEDILEQYLIPYSEVDRNNQFLQLLNKANNWVTFFVKSIIQDSAKKGYEKVVFPTKETVVKIESAEKLTWEGITAKQEIEIPESLKWQLENEGKTFKELIENKKWIKSDNTGNTIIVANQEYNGKKGYYAWDGNTYFHKENQSNKRTDIPFDEFLNIFNKIRQRGKDSDKFYGDRVIEISQHERDTYLNPREGGRYANLVNTAKFYENNIANVLKKQGYNPKQVTDEYGNTWNEIEISPERETAAIYLQKETESERPSNKELDKKIKNFLASIGVTASIVDEIRDRQGNKLDAIAKADMLNKIIEVVNGKADITTLPEEAAHFFVEMLGENHPLYKDMYSKITSYALYTETVEKYKNSKLYRNSDGTINFDKLKKEAIGKLIAQHIIERFDEEETAKRVEAARSWWKKVWDALLKIFNRGEKVDDKLDNPFKEVAKKVIEADVSDLDLKLTAEEEYLQINNTAEVNFNKAKNLQDEIKLDDEIDPKTGKKKHVYMKNGKPIVDADGTPRSVNENIVKPWYKKKFPTDKRSDVQKVIDDLKAEYGVGLHKDIEKIGNRYVDSNTGLVRDVSIPGDKLEVNADVEKKLDGYIKALIRSYPTGTRFMFEARIYNQKKDLPGTVDLLVFLPDGSADIYDWKSQEVRDGETELKWFKEPAYRLQLDEYKKAIEEQFGITEFNKIRAIPIRTMFKMSKVLGGWVPQNLKDIEIGPLDPSLVPENKEYLLPVVAEKESTGDKKLDKLIERLYIIYETLSNKSTKDKDKKTIELNKLKKTIRTLQVKKDLKSFVDSGLVEINKYYDKYSKNDIDISEILEAKDIINVYSEGSVYLRNLLIDLNIRISKEEDAEEKRKLEKIKDDFKTMALNAKDLLELLQERAKELANEVAEKNGIKGLLNPERAMDYLKRNFRSLSQLETSAAQLFYKIRNKAFQTRDLEIEKTNERLAELKSNLETWASSKGLSGNKIFDGILDIDSSGKKTGDFLKIYSDEFIKLKNEAIKKGDAAWIKANTVFDSEAYLKAFNKYKDLVEGSTYSADPKLDREKKDAAIIKWVELHNGEKSTVATLLPKGNFLKPKDIWWSEKYKNLNKPENAPLKEVYDEFQKMLRDSEKAGMIDYEFGFIPSIIKTKMESFVLGDMGKVFDKQSFLQSLTVDSSQEFGQLDINGKQVRKIPVYYTYDLGADKSFDLFKVFSIWGTHTSNYKAMSSIEDTANVLLFVEKNKESLQTNKFGKVKKGGEPVKDNTINSEVLEKFVNFYVYGQKVDASDDFTFKIAGKEISATRGLQSLLRYFSIKTLALNPISGTANLVGGTVNASFVAKKNIYFGDSDWGWGQYAMTSRNEKALAFLDYAGIDLEDRSFYNSNQLSISDTLKNWTSEKFFIIQRTGDKLVTYPVALAMYRTHMVDENGKIVSIREYVKAKNNYNNVYNLPSQERKELMKKVNDEIEEYTKNNSLYAKSKIVDDKLEIEGVDRKSDTFVEFRNKIKKVNKTILGNSTSEDINQFRIGMLGQVMMQFRSWIPGLVIERFGDLAYDTDLETYNYGKARVFFKHLRREKFLPLLGELITGFGDNTIERAKARYQEMLIRKAEQGDLNFKDRMSEAEFIDMYIANLRSMMRELLVLLAFLSLVVWAHTVPPDEDEDAKNVRKLMAKAMDKYYNEVAFFYNPSEFQSLIKSPVPITGLFTDIYNFGEHSMKEIWGLGTENEKLIDKSHPMKYFNKMVPVVRQGQDIFAIFDDDFRKNWGIKI